MWQLLAIFLGGILLFYWLALMATIWWWFNAIVALCKGHFTRAAIWGCMGAGMVLWWRSEDVIPNPWAFHEWLKTSAVIVGIGALVSFLRWLKKQRATQTTPTIPEWTPPPDAYWYASAEPGSTAPVIEVEYKRLPN